jgi:hypothetical protein
MSTLNTRPITPTPSSFALPRLVKTLKHGRDFAETRYRDQPHVLNAYDELILRKAAVPGMSSVSAPDLATLGIFDAATALLLAGDSALEAARSRMRELPFAVPTPRQSDSRTGGGWVGPTTAIPVARSFLDPLTFKPWLLGSIVVFADELLRAPNTDAVIRNMIFGAQGRVESSKFLDPSVAATDESPASITHDAVSVPWTGNVPTDLSNLLDAIETTGKGLALMARPGTLAMLAVGLGAPLSSHGIAILPCPNAPRRLVVAADLSEIAVASTAIAIDPSNEATLEMESEPSQSLGAGSPLAPVPTEVVSLFQANSTAYKVSRYVNWSPREGSVAYIAGAGSPA